MGFPEMPNNEPNELPHILIHGSAYTEEYTSPSSGGKSIILPKRQRQVHGKKLLRQFENIRSESESLIADQKAYGIDAGNGIYIQFESEPAFDLKFESLEARASGIELVAVQRTENKTYATVFVPEGKLHVLTNKISDYIKKLRPKGKFKNKELVESISEINRAALEALWTDDQDLLPSSDQQAIWWEIWLRAGEDPQGVIDFFKTHAEHLGLIIDPELIQFPDRIVVTAYGTKNILGRSVRLLNCIAELRKAKDTSDFFTGMDAFEQRDWMRELLSLIVPPSKECPLLCILDTGVNNNHPMLISFLHDEDMHSYDPNWNVDDRCGHGTEMAGLALYGDLSEILSKNGPVEISHQLESVKIKPHHIENPPHLYGDITIEAVARAEAKKPYRERVICMAVSATDIRDRGRPTSWSAAIDKLCSGADDETQRLIIIAAGNTPPEDRHHYPYSSMSDIGIHDPGQAWNAITIGAYTEKAFFDSNEYYGWQLVAPKGDLSPCSSTSMTWQRPWPLKPDIVLEGGNMAIDPAVGQADYIDSLGLLSTNYLHTTGKPFVITGDTSAATALASRMAAKIQAEYPNYWPETIRALMIHSAEWTEAMLRRFGLKTKNDYENLLRYCGYGVPNLRKALWSAQNDTTLIAQDILQPFDKKQSRYTTRDLNLHAIPWPKETLLQLGETPVEMRVTLSYFIEPNPARRGWGRKYSYASHGLRFDVKRPEETYENFRASINRLARDEEKGQKSDRPEDKYWDLGANLRKLGTIHSDTWRGTAADLAERGHIAVFPVIGWWRENPKQGRWNKLARYSLVVTIRAPETEIEFYNTIKNIGCGSFAFT